MTSSDDIREWYNRKHHTRGQGTWRPPEAYAGFLDLLKVRKGGKLLDVGCGTGFLLADAGRRGLDAKGIDISDEGAAIAAKNAPFAQITVGQMERLPYAEREFDYLTCLGVLEHALDIKESLRQMARVVKADGKLLIIVPNSQYLFWKLHGIKGTDQQVIRESPLRMAEWLQLFREAGLVATSITQDKWPMKVIHPFREKNPLTFLKRTASKIIWIFLPLRFCYQFVFVLKKEEPQL